MLFRWWMMQKRDEDVLSYLGRTLVLLSTTHWSAWIVVFVWCGLLPNRTFPFLSSCSVPPSTRSSVEISFRLLKLSGTPLCLLSSKLTDWLLRLFVLEVATPNEGAESFIDLLPTVTTGFKTNWFEEIGGRSKWKCSPNERFFSGIERWWVVDGPMARGPSLFIWLIRPVSAEKNQKCVAKAWHYQENDTYFSHSHNEPPPQQQ